MEKIRVLSVVVKDKRIEIEYDYSDGLKQYFIGGDNTFFTEYSENIQDVPISMAVIPFVADVLPIIWLTDSLLELEELDSVFYHSIPEIKNGYVHMHEMLTFRGDLKVDRVLDNNYPCNKNACFFSGGVDSFATLIQHREENPLLITLLGSDIKLCDKKGLAKLILGTKKVAYDFNRLDYCFVSSNFRTIINEGNLNGLVKKSGDGWWHGFQHGLSIISLSAPLAYKKSLKTVYIASTNTKGDKCSCASDPTIDNYIKFGTTAVSHDQYDMSRQAKTHLITEYNRTHGEEFKLRVCWISKGGDNCCHCEKCLRTMMGIIAENADPRNFGFVYTESDLINSERVVRESLYKASRQVRLNWLGTVNRYKETKVKKSDPNINWIYELDPFNPLNKTAALMYDFKRQVRRVYNKLIRIIG